MPETSQRLPSLLVEHREILACPACAGELELDAPEIRCAGCGQTFPTEAGIPLLFWPNRWDPTKADVTDLVKSFYESTPFPNYDDLDSAAGLVEKAKRAVFARMLDDQLPHGARVLEAGCGTGQLCNFLGLTYGRAVFGTDICFNSLELGQTFRQANTIDNTTFVQMNLFRPVFRPSSFDLVISNGVLHHTSDPFLGFQTLGRLVKPGGHIIIGLYNRYGRFTTHFRRFLFRLTGNRITGLDPYMRSKKLSAGKKRTWFLDQYENPHESSHTIGEVLTFFDRAGFEFVNSVPRAVPFEGFSADERLFTARDRGTRFDHFLVQLGMLVRGGREGGFFVMIGTRSGDPPGS